jgi:hypothetical protein
MLISIDPLELLLMMLLLLMLMFHDVVLKKKMNWYWYLYWPSPWTPSMPISNSFLNVEFFTSFFSKKYKYNESKKYHNYYKR